MTTQTNIQYMKYERLPAMNLQELVEYKQQLEEKHEKYLEAMDYFPRKMEEWLSSEWEMKHDYDEIRELLYHIHLEFLIREERLREKTISELEAIAENAYLEQIEKAVALELARRNTQCK